MRHFEVEINDLKKQLIDMTNIIKKMIVSASLVLIEKAPQQADEVFVLEKEVNIQEIVIDDKCLKLIALNQPVGADLRFITSAIKINSDLERMGDEAVNISEKALDLIKFPSFNLESIKNIPKIVSAVQNMVVDSIKAFNENDLELAKFVLEKDDEVDELTRKLFAEVKDLLVKAVDINNVQSIVDLMFIVKSIERLGDHATNISEDVIFMINGKDVRHPKSNTIK
jgi:phosphate transport system protein